MSESASPQRGSARGDQDPTRRTYLAVERTQLAWWRTGLTALAVAVGVGRVVPGLGGAGARWPYAVVGGGFAVYGIALIVFGSMRATAVESAIEQRGFWRSPRWALAALTGAGVALGLLTLVLVLID